MKKILLALAICLAALTSARASVNGDELIKLARSGVDGEVMQAYIESSPEAFDLSADDIITLKDLGVPAKVISAALRRGHVLDSLAIASGTARAAADTGAASDSAQAAALVPAAAPVAPPAANLNISFFYDALSPYGNWIMIDGDWCWQPNAVLVSADWAPYYNHGHWVYTDWGWCWVSDYSWGWAPFHYGRWFRHPRHGWCWWPDNEWGPAWVIWRHSSDYWGWAPLPRRLRYRHHDGYYRGNRRVREHDIDKLVGKDYFYLPTGHMADTRPWVNIVPPRRGDDIYKRTVFAPDAFGEDRGHIFNRGPVPTDVTRGGNTVITPIAIVHTDLRPGQPIPRGTVRTGKLEIYGPAISSDTPTRPTTRIPAGAGLPSTILQRRQAAEQRTLDQQKAAAAAAEQQSKKLINSAKQEPDPQKKTVFRIEAEIQDMRARQAKESITRIKQWQPVPDAPATPATPSTPPVTITPERREAPQVQDQLRNQIQRDAREEQQKQKVMEDRIRQPEVRTPPPPPPSQPPAVQNPPPSQPNQPPARPNSGSDKRNEDR